jgi:hypothetical protein
MARTIAAIFVGDHRLTHSPMENVKKMFLGDSGCCIEIDSIESVDDELCIPSIFFGNKIIIVPESLFSESLCNRLKLLIENVSSQCMLICRVDSISAKCMSIIKSMPENAVRIIRLGLLNGFESAVDLVIDRAISTGGKIDVKAANMLVSIVGHEDVSMLICEVDKLLVVSNGHITEGDVNLCVVGDSSFRFFSLYTALANGDFSSSIREINEHWATKGIESVDMAISKLLSVGCRSVNSFDGEFEEVHIDKFNEHWWDEPPTKVKARPTKFMVDCAMKIVNRIGDGVQSLLKESSSDFLLHRNGKLPYSIDRLYLKAAAICYGRRKDGFDILHWNRPIIDGDGDVRPNS